MDEVWLEFINHDHCGLCGNTGVIDTRSTVVTNAGVKCGVRAYCICLNGRAMKEQRADLERWPMPRGKQTTMAEDIAAQIEGTGSARYVCNAGTPYGN